MKFKTSSGSVYTMEKTTMVWKRDNPRHKLRTESGDLHAWPEVTVGEPVVICGSPLEIKRGIRYVVTTPVVEIYDAG